MIKLLKFVVIIVLVVGGFLFWRLGGSRCEAPIREAVEYAVAKVEMPDVPALMIDKMEEAIVDKLCSRV